MKLLLSGLMLFSFSVFGESFKISGSLYHFSSREGLLIAKCESECDALKAIKKHQKINLSSFIKKDSYVGSIGSEFCVKVYGARSLLGVAQNQDRRSFCLFKDGSLVEINSLSNYLTRVLRSESFE